MTATLTKTQMAQTIVQALYNSSTPIDANHPRVVRIATRYQIKNLTDLYDLARRILGARS